MNGITKRENIPTIRVSLWRVLIVALLVLSFPILLCNCSKHLDTLQLTIPDGYKGLICLVEMRGGHDGLLNAKYSYKVPPGGIAYVDDRNKASFFTFSAITYSGARITTELEQWERPARSDECILYSIRSTKNYDVTIFFLGTKEEYIKLEELIQSESDVAILEKKSEIEQEVWNAIRNPNP